MTAADAGAVLAPDDPPAHRLALAALAERSLLVADVDGADDPLLDARDGPGGGRRAGSTRPGRADEVRRRHAEHVAAVAGRGRRPSPHARRGRRPRPPRRRRRRGRGPPTAGPGSTTRARVGHERRAVPRRPLEPLVRAGRLGRGAAGRAGGPPAAPRRPRWPSPERPPTAATWPRAREASRSSRPRPAAGCGRSPLELLADVALYEGDLAAAAARPTSSAGSATSSSDPHVAAFAAIDRSLARTYGGDPDGALDDLDGPTSDDLAPTDAAWLAYARGEALSAGRRPGRRRRATARRSSWASSVGSRFVVAVALTSLADRATPARGDIERRWPSTPSARRPSAGTATTPTPSPRCAT